MHLSRLAERHPDKPAVVESATGRVLDYRSLDTASRRVAAVLRQAGLRPGDHAALVFGNVAEYFVAAWACQRSGLLWTPVNHHLTAHEAAYIVRDCGARALLVQGTGPVAELAAAVAPLAPAARLRLAAGGGVPGFAPMDGTGPDHPAAGEEPAGEREGSYMFYSSGTTGRPKGIVPALTGGPFGAGLPLDHHLGALFGVGPDTVYLSPAPLYHAAPTGWTLGTMRHGGTVVLMDHFDAASLLAAIERHRVTHVQLVPTMMIRLCDLPESVRTRHDLGSLRAVVHAAAPCPVEVKRRFIDWFGPIVWEYYAGSEGNCFFLIDSAAWLAHPGSVGRPLVGTVHVLDDEGEPVPCGQVGTVWFEGTADFRYHNDPQRTAEAHNDRGWSTLGDMGRLDEDGYLYLVDRRVDLILSGGVNIYPREVEDVLIGHPAVHDVAVVGVPDRDLGRRVHAVVQPADGHAADDALAAELAAYCRERLAHFKCPRSLSFTSQLPRTPTGKLLRRVLADSATAHRPTDR